MRRQRLLSLLAVLTLAGGLAACGSDDELSTQVPKTSPDLTIPTGTTETPAAASTTDTTSTTATTATTGVTPPAAVTPPAGATPPAPSAGSTTTGGQSPSTGTPTTGQGGGAEFEDFCAQNPGAC
jgi:hypothetical protein